MPTIVYWTAGQLVKPRTGQNHRPREYANRLSQKFLIVYAIYGSISR